MTTFDIETIRENITEAIYQSHRIYIDDDGEIHHIPAEMSQKSLSLKAHEKQFGVTCDTAYPLSWGNLVREHFGLRNIGSWCWAYGDGIHGQPMPCCYRSLTLLESMLGQEVPFIYNNLYSTS
jgi:hypothetical protein